MQDMDFSHLEPLGAALDVAPDQPVIEVTRDENAGARRLTLLVPLRITEAGKTRRLTSIRMRHPSQSEIDAWGRGDIEGRRAMLCVMTSQPAQVIGALAWPDAAALHQMFSDMVPDFILNSDI
ncbi:MAG: hypothetical protein ACT6RF_09155 [Allorhizobium sp.]|uniref:hypothetical protein n=1 Tax=Allorhizobium sp. TaxID=633478 RepID=UPI004033BBEC